ncbi:hypothetical protein ACFSQJ_07835 [Croceitalea marina]|uniref:Uncharacterized protein n=1 Tax=Croceitalea marina TaxID=1775166 RepID=A0ABW5MVN0_9FLAO
MTPQNYDDFTRTLTEEMPDTEWPLALQALWYASNNDWEASHDIAQDLHAPIGSWIHAHLHRAEGDKFNADYWYRLAGKPFPSLSIQDEIKEIIESLLSK